MLLCASTGCMTLTPKCSGLAVQPNCHTKDAERQDKVSMRTGKEQALAKA